MSRKRRSVADEPFLVVRSSASDLPPSGEIGLHAHEWHQLTCVAQGLMVVSTPAGAWVAPASCAVWVPAGASHAIRFVGAGALRVLYLRPGMSERLPQDCRAVQASDLLRALVARTVKIGMLDSRDPAEAAMAELIVAELGAGGPPPTALSEPESETMRQAGRLITSGQSATTAGLAAALNLSVRTLERRFRAETGLSVGRWRQQRQLLQGLELIAGGALVKTAAGACGFASASAFIAAFRRIFGVTPQRFFDGRAGALARPGDSA